MSELHQRIAAAVDAIPLFDTHEHFYDEKTRLSAKREIDVFYFLHYVECDIKSAGLPEETGEFAGGTLSTEEKRRRFLKYWPFVEHTGYGRAFKIMANDLFGVSEIGEATYDLLNERASSFAKPGYYTPLLRERANITRALRIVWAGQDTLCDLDHLFPVPVFDNFAGPTSRADVRKLERETDTRIHSLKDLETALDAVFDKRQNQGMVAVKCFLAYRRSLDFAHTSAAAAETVFQRVVCALPPSPLGAEETKPLQDYMVHQIVQRAVERKLPINIHTGYQNSNDNVFANGKPEPLINLILGYPTARFVLLHCGWPYTDQVLAFAKMFPNVFPDMAWAHILAPGMARRLLHDLIDTVPANKILGFGGDYNFAEGSYAHAKLARRGISRVLTDRIEEGTFTEEQAIALAKRIMHDNASALYGFPQLAG
jgi:hypothetical protein